MMTPCRTVTSTPVVWGPLAGYFAARAGEPLTLAPVHPAIDG